MSTILFVAHDSKIHGGANKSLCSILTFFHSNSKYNVILLLPSKDKDMVEFATKNKIEFIVFPYKWMISSKKNWALNYLKKHKISLNFMSDYFSSFILAHKLRRRKIDLIYSNTRVVFMGAFIAKRMQIPHLWHIRELLNENNLLGIKDEMDFISRNSDGILVISNFMKKTFINAKISSTYLVFNGLPQQNIMKKTNLNSNEVLIVGNVIDAKNQLDAIQAILYLRKKYNLNLRLHLVGSLQSEEYVKKIDNFIKDNQLENQIILHGEMEVNELHSLRSKTNIELICSRNEAFGRVIIEAMMSENIIIGANAGAIPEIIVDEKNGFLYEVGNYEQLAEIIYRVKKKRLIMDKIIKEAKEYAEDNFSERSMTTNVENVVKKIINDFERK